MAFAALTILLQSLDGYSHPNRSLCLVNNPQLQSLSENLKFLQEFLENCTNNNCNNKTLMNSFEAKVRDLSYRALDVIEVFVSENGCRSEEAMDIFDSQNSVHLTLQEILGEIDSIKNKAIGISEEISADEMLVRDLATNREIEEYCSTKPEDVVGNIDEGVEVIVDRLRSSCPRLEIVSFVGENTSMVAWRVHNHPLVENHFHCRAFIEVVEKPDGSVDGYSITRYSLKRYLGCEEIAGELYKRLKFKRYLVVLYSSSARNFQDAIQFKRCFPENYRGSRLILANSLMGVTNGPWIHSHSPIHSPSPIHSHSPIHVNKSRLRKIFSKILLCQKYKEKSFMLEEESFMLAEESVMLEEELISKQKSFILKEEHISKQNYRVALAYLCKKVFAEESFPLELIAIAKQIVTNCQGVQQVLGEAARLLSWCSRTPEDWGCASTSIGFVYQIFFPDKVSRIYDGMLPLSEKREQENTVSEENAVVGIYDDLIKIKDKLTGGTPRLEIIAVLGMGGIGKTTLAKAVFDDPLIQYHFYICAWIKVSQVYNLRGLLLGLLQNIDPLADEIHRMNKEQLREKLYRRLKGQRFLIVVDDMWSTQAWDEMKRCFPDDRNGSRILLTSRLRSLADHVGSNYTHQMRFLNKDHSWKLLQQRIFLSKKSCPSELVDIGEKIAEKCKGLPLAILVVAGVLSNMKNTRQCWENFAGSMSSLLTSHPEQYVEILAMSYNYLPQHLKACFLYLCVFPEDSEIEVWRLIRLWVAEGFVKPEDFRSLEEIAEQYLEDLINRNLVFVGKRSSIGYIKTCCIHDLLRDLSLREAKRENFMHVITGQVQVPSEDNSIVRRLSLHSGSCAKFHSEHSIQPTHSLLCFDVGFDDIQMFLSTFKFKLLRVLDIGFMRFDYFPLVILRLAHLRFIALTAACDLPSSISELWNLQTVIVQGPWIRRKYGKFPTLPIEIWKMSNLRHLNLTATCFLPDALRAEDDGNNSSVLQNLQTLSSIRLACCTKEVFENLPNLKKLGIRETKEDSDSCKSFPSKLFYLHNLETLKCSFNQSNQKKIPLPDWNAFPQMLKNLTLSGSYLPWEDMDTLGMLPNLEVLKLKNYAFCGQVWEPNEEGFQRLKLLLIEKTDLVHWSASRYNFPCLQFLVLRSCEFLEEIPCDIVDDLQLIELHHCSSSAESSAKKIQEEQRNMDNDGLVVRIIIKQVHQADFQCES